MLWIYRIVAEVDLARAKSGAISSYARMVMQGSATEVAMIFVLADRYQQKDTKQFDLLITRLTTSPTRVKNLSLTCVVVCVATTG
jgi:hypothetical protein